MNMLEENADSGAGLEVLEADLAELQNSVYHLVRSNVELAQFLQESPGDRDLEEALEENKVVLVRKRQRVKALKNAVADLKTYRPHLHAASDPPTLTNNAEVVVAPATTTPTAVGRATSCVTRSPAQATSSSTTTPPDANNPVDGGGDRNPGMGDGARNASSTDTRSLPTLSSSSGGAGVPEEGASSQGGSQAPLSSSSAGVAAEATASGDTFPAGEAPSSRGEAGGVGGQQQSETAGVML